MSPIHKYEAIGIFLSVAVMAVVLSIVRFQSDIFSWDPKVSGVSQQGALIVASSDDTSRDDERAKTIKDALTTDGDLIKLVIDDITLGKGESVKFGDAVSVHYIGTTRDGVQFDSSYGRGKPFEFTIGAGKVIEGWEKGLIGMQVGGHRVLVIPPSMAYGNRQVGSIAPNSPLVFSIELLKIN